MQIAILFGGQSREREISFAGGRTVYDNLNKSLFEAIPVFVDSFGNFVEINWEFVYKGTIRDFYPPVDSLPLNHNPAFQLYAEQLGNLNNQEQLKLIEKIGRLITLAELKQKCDFVFLCLHGPKGEDGTIQGLLEYYNIPYSGSGVLASAIGINKAIQKELMINKGFNSPNFIKIDRDAFIENKNSFFQAAKKNIKFPLVVKPANQGSSIGVSILNEADEHKFIKAVEKAFFIHYLKSNEWEKFNQTEKINYCKTLADIREGIGMPMRLSSTQKHKITLFKPDELLEYLNEQSSNVSEFVFEALDTESTVLVEGFIDGKEFSCIVLEDENGKAVALPPTEIRKGKELFDYRSKYLPGLSRKITPIDLPNENIELIRKECERLFYELKFDVYARIDGFIKNDGTIFLNDPNTTSGMMPSSFFFHQAAEIGLNPSQFLTYIIRTSVAKRYKFNQGNLFLESLLMRLDGAIKNDQQAQSEKIKVAVVLGGYSSERHISVESGRNVFEKLSSSEKYTAFPVFLTGNNDAHSLYLIPINLLLKDNADDIKEKVENFKEHSLITKIKSETLKISQKYASLNNITEPLKISYNDLKNICDEVFIALHGRPGEDGAVQQKLEELSLPYNGSNKESSSITIDKYRTNELLQQNGFLVAKHFLVTKDDWQKNKQKIESKLEKEIGYPFIAKPVDDGCSSAVKKIKSLSEFNAFCKLIFRKEELLDEEASNILNIKAKEEFPIKQVVLVEELISRNNAEHFLEITGGMLTQFDEKGNVSYEVFEASEALADGDVLSLEEKFLAGQGQNITPARYSNNANERQRISNIVKDTLGRAAKALGVNGYCRIDAFVRIFKDGKVEVVFIEVNSLPGMTPATCIFHQAAINNYKPFEFIDKILDFGKKKVEKISYI
ncbi:MAG: D-alanine--D-alanine ligase [Bacteroidetes bacterium]|nr:D-alanine--D-alanine ligase [Bacteroidota bacterium]